MVFPTPTPADIQRVVDFVVATVQPERIVLFGSAARNELAPGSDLDMLVVVAEGTDTLRVAQRLYLAKARHGIARILVDFVVTTPGRHDAHKCDLGSVYLEVERSGRELYAAA